MVTSVNNMEQWKLDGDCNKCRKAGYCKHYCSKKKSREKIKWKNVKTASITD